MTDDTWLQGQCRWLKVKVEKNAFSKQAWTSFFLSNLGLNLSRRIRNPQTIRPVSGFFLWFDQVNSYVTEHNHSWMELECFKPGLGYENVAAMLSLCARSSCVAFPFGLLCFSRCAIWSLTAHRSTQVQILYACFTAFSDGLLVPMGRTPFSYWNSTSATPTSKRLRGFFLQYLKIKKRIKR